MRLNASRLWVSLTYFDGLDRNFVHIADPLNPKLEKDQPFRFERLSETETKALETLHNQVLSPLIISLPRRSGRYTSDTNSCYRLDGWGLLQEQPEGLGRPMS